MLTSKYPDIAWTIPRWRQGAFRADYLGNLRDQEVWKEQQVYVTC